MPQSVTSQSSYYSTSSQYENPVGRKELLKWCSEITGVSCNRLEDLRSGVVLLKIMSIIWPSAVNLKRIKWKVSPKNDKDISINWDTIRTCMIDLKLPMEVYDRKSIMAGKFKQCYTFLVMLFFLQNLSQNHNFSVDFAHPIDGKLATFLQSTDSVECLARGGGLKLEDIPNREWRDDQSDVISESSSVTSYQTSKYSHVGQYSRPASAVSNFSNADHDPVTGSSAAARRSDSRSHNDTEHPGNYAAAVERDPIAAIRGDEQNIALEKGSSSQNQHLHHQNPIHAQRSPTHSSTTATSTASYLSNVDRSFDVYGRGIPLNTMDSSLNSGPYGEADVQNVPFDENRISSASQTMTTDHKMERMLIRSLKAKREIEELRRMLEESHEKIKQFEGSHSGGKELSVQDESRGKQGASDGILSWRTDRNKRRGELLLTKMRYEIESLNRQISYLKQEKESIVKKSENRIQELRSAQKNDLTFQRDLHHNQTTSQQLILLNEKLKDQRDYSLELDKIHDEISFEADRIRQSGLHTEDDEAIEDELLRLRQLRVAQSHQVRSLEEGNKALQELCDKLQSNLRKEQDKNRQLHEHYKLEELEIFGEEITKSVAPIIENRDDASTEDNLQEPPRAAQPQQIVPLPEQIDGTALSKRERSLLSKLKIMEDEMKNLQAKYNADVEHLNFELFKHQQRPTREILTSTKDPMEIEFDQEQKIERIESDLAKLKRANEYLRERSVLFDNLNTESGHEGYTIDTDNDDALMSETVAQNAEHQDATVLLQSPYVGNPQHMDMQYGQLVHETKGLIADPSFTASQKERVNSVTKLFWKVVADIAILQQRIRQSNTTLKSLDKRYRELDHERAIQYPQFQQTIDRIRSEYKLELERERQQHSKEKASLQINLQLLEDNLREMRDEMLEGPSHTSKLFELAMLDDARRFWGLRQKVKYNQEEIAAYRLREKLWTQLIECQRKNIEHTEQFAAAESYEEAMEINVKREELDMEATNLMQQLQTLTQQQQQYHHQQRKPDSSASDDEIDVAVKEATALVQNQLDQVNKRLEDVVKQRERDIDRAREFDHKVKDLQLELEKERHSQEIIHKEYRDILQKKNDEVNALNNEQQQERKHVDVLQTQVADLRQQIEELTEHPECWGLGSTFLDDSVVITMTEDESVQIVDILASSDADTDAVSSHNSMEVSETVNEPKTDRKTEEEEVEDSKEIEEDVEEAPKTPELKSEESEQEIHPTTYASSPPGGTNTVDEE